jgi:hypothetical protein
MAAGNPLLVRLVTRLTWGDQLLPIAHHVRPQTACDVRLVTDGAAWRAADPAPRHRDRARSAT